MPYTSRTYDIGSTRFHELYQTGMTGTGITGISISERGFIVNSAAARLKRAEDKIEIMQGQSPEVIARAFEADPNARLSAMNSILMIPWANRMIGPVEIRDSVPCVKVDFMGDTRYVPTNFEDRYRLHGLAYSNEYQDIRTFKLPSGGIALTGTTMITGEQWFSDLLIEHTIGITDGFMIRNVKVTNTGNSSAPVSVGEHPYFRIPESQNRADVTFKIPATSTILLGDDGNPDFTENPIKPVKYSPLAELFAAGRKLENINLNNSFLRPQRNTPDALRGVEAGVLFKSAGYGVFVSTGYSQSVNVLHAFAPLGTQHPADGKAVALEFQGNLLAPLCPDWELFSPLDFGELLDPSGLSILKPGQSMEWDVAHTARDLD